MAGVISMKNFTYLVAHDKNWYWEVYEITTERTSFYATFIFSKAFQ